MTVVTKVVEAREAEPVTLKIDSGDGKFESATKIPFSRKLKWLTNLLWGGSVLLAFEHVWHGEVVPWFPFLTAASNSVDASIMLHEMATVGVFMAVLVTVVWGVMLLVANTLEKKVCNEQPAAN